MWMPNKENSLVRNNKITDYLLNLEHKVGGPKAKFFLQVGFQLTNIQVLKSALLQHAVDREIIQETNTNFGIKYKLLCIIETPNNRNPCITTVWVINKGDDRPTLVTAYPAKFK